MSEFRNYVGMTTAGTPGTGPITLGSALAAPERSFFDAYGAGSWTVDVEHYSAAGVALGCEHDAVYNGGNPGTLTRGTPETPGTLLNLAAGGSVRVVQTAAAANRWEAAGITAVTTVAASGASLTITPPSRGNAAYAITLDQACAISFGDGPAGIQCEISVELIQGGAGGFLPSFANATWAGGVAPTFNSILGKRDLLTFRIVGGDKCGIPVSMSRTPQIPALPLAPASITVTAPSASSAQITAGAVVAFPAVTGYNIYHGITSGVLSLLASNQALPYTHSGITPAGQTHYYKVAAVNSVGEGAQSSEGSVLVGAEYALFSDNTFPNDICYHLARTAFRPGTATFTVEARIFFNNAIGSGKTIFAAWRNGGSTSTQKSFWFFIDNTDTLTIWLSDGTSVVAVNANAAHGYAVSDPAVTFRAVVNTASGTVDFYKSADDITYTQIGTQVSFAAMGGGIAPSFNDILCVGTDAGGNARLATVSGNRGRVYRMRLTIGATVVVNATASVGSNNFTDTASAGGSPNAWVKGSAVTFSGTP